MRKMKDSGIDWIGEIPEDWQFIKNKYILNSMYSGGTPSSTNADFYSENGIPFVSVSDMSNSDFVFDTKKKITNEGINDKNLKILPKGTILYSIYATIGAISELKIEATVSQAILALELNNSMNKSFYKYNLFAMRDYIYSSANGNTQFNLNAQKVWNFTFLFPPIKTQYRIANYLDSKCSKIDEYIAKQQQLIEKLKEYKQAIITEAVTKGLNPDVPMKDSGIEWIGEIPEHWKIAKVGYVTIKIGSGKTPKGGADVYSDEGVLFLRSQNIYNEGLQVEEAKYITSDIDEEMSNTRVYMNDVLLNITGGSIGRSCIYNLNSYANVNQHVCIIRTNDRLVLPTYMHYFWISHVGQISVDIHQTGANREGLNFEQISKTAIPILSLEEQKEISDYLDKKCLSINSTINQKQEIIDKLTEYKKSLIYEVVTGKKEV